MKNYNQVKHFSILLIIVSVILGGVAVFEYNANKDLTRQTESQYTKSFNEAVDYMRDIDVLLTKSEVVMSTKQFSKLSSEIFKKASLAKGNLGALPLSNAVLDNTSKFLSQVGDFSYNLSQKMMDGQTITGEEKDTLRMLSDYAETFYTKMISMQNDLYSGKITMGGMQNVSDTEENSTVLLSLEKIEEEFQEYPSLIYDGPFSEHIEKAEPAALAGKEPITETQAKDIASVFLFDKSIDDIRLAGENQGKIPTYNLIASQGENECYLEITKINGMVLNMSCGRKIGDPGIKWEEAMSLAKSFLDAMGFSSMKESYYEVTDKTAIINFAYVNDDGVVIYPDLLKVKIALDNGEVIGFESMGYVYSHKENRNLSSPKISLDNARGNVSSNLKIKKEQLVVIPNQGKREILCYEFQGEFDGKNFLVYINADTGKEEDVLLLIESENGILTM